MKKNPSKYDIQRRKESRNRQRHRLMEQQLSPESSSESEYLTASDYSTDSEYFDAEEPHIFEHEYDQGQLLAINPGVEQYLRCVICLEGDNYEGMGQLIYPCNCNNEMGRYHFTCLCDYIGANYDRRCPQCRTKFNDPRIERYDITTNNGTQKMVRFRDYGGVGAHEVVNLTEAIQNAPGADYVRAMIAYYTGLGQEVNENQVWNGFAQYIDEIPSDEDNEYLGFNFEDYLDNSDVEDDTDSQFSDPFVQNVWDEFQTELEETEAPNAEIDDQEQFVNQLREQTLGLRLGDVPEFGESSTNNVFNMDELEPIPEYRQFINQIRQRYGIEDESRSVDDSNMDQFSRDTQQFRNRMRERYGTLEDRVQQQQEQSELVAQGIQRQLHFGPYHHQLEQDIPPPKDDEEDDSEG